MLLCLFVCFKSAQVVPGGRGVWESLLHVAWEQMGQGEVAEAGPSGVSLPWVFLTWALTPGPGHSLWWGLPVQCSVPGLYSPDARSTHVSCNKQKCLETLLNLPRGTKSFHLRTPGVSTWVEANISSVWELGCPSLTQARVKIENMLISIKKEWSIDWYLLQCGPPLETMVLIERSQTQRPRIISFIGNTQNR